MQVRCRRPGLLLAVQAARRAGRIPLTVEPTAPRTQAVPGEQELVLGRYKLLRRLGAGGMGTVWLAHDEHLERAVAVKRITLGGPEVAERAQREARAAARLSHPGIVAPALRRRARTRRRAARASVVASRTPTT